MEFEKSKSKKSLIFSELMCDYPRIDTKTVAEQPIADESLFRISTIDPWYGDIIVYLQTQSFRHELSRSQRRKFVSSLNNIILLATHYTVVVRTLFFNVVSPMKKMKRF